MNRSVGIITPARNAAAFVEAAIHSVLRQSFTDWELLVVDDGSTDGTGDRVRRFSDVRIRLIAGSGRGLARALNLALASATGRSLAFLDADDVWQPRYLEQLVGVLEERPEVDLAFAASEWIGASGGRIGRSTVAWQGALSYTQLFEEYKMVTRSAFLVRTAVARRLNGFDAALSAGSDHDFCLRVARLRPGNCYGMKDALVQYRRRPGQITEDRPLKRRAWQELVEKHRLLEPELVRRHEAAATAKSLRALAALAYDAADWRGARALFAEALGRAPLALLAESRTWLTGAAVLGSWLPAPVRRPLERAGRGWLLRRRS